MDPAALSLFVAAVERWKGKKEKSCQSMPTMNDTLWPIDVQQRYCITNEGIRLESCDLLRRDARASVCPFRASLRLLTA